jgi:O-antigen biosynthesis protein WbqP
MNRPFRTRIEAAIKRLFDITLAVLLILIFAVPMLVLALLIKVTSEGAVLYWSKRVGKENRIFIMPKFRSMRSDTPEIATHLLDRPTGYLNPMGAFLRKTSLDELPQLYSILKGDLSFVGPRPALYNQDDLISSRTEKGIHKLMPGLTGWAQVNGRDELQIDAKVEFDREYLAKRGVMFDAKILWLTFAKVIKQEGIQH